MPATKSTRKVVEPSVLDELVFIGRSGPVGLVAEPTLWAPVDDDDEDDRYRPALVAVTLPASVSSTPPVRELVARVVVLVFLAASMVLAVALGIGYAAR